MSNIYPSDISNQAYADRLIDHGASWSGSIFKVAFDLSSADGHALDDVTESWILSTLNQLSELFGFFYAIWNTHDAVLQFDGFSGDGTWTYNSATSAIGGPLHLYKAQTRFDQTWPELDSSTFDYGSLGTHEILHQVLRQLGLDRPGDYSRDADYFSNAAFLRDTKQFSAMSYFEAEESGTGTSHWFFENGEWVRKYLSTPGLMDLFALENSSFAGQFDGYDLSSSARSSNTRYGYGVEDSLNDVFDFDVNVAPVITIHDGGGKDVLDLSGDTVAVRRFIAYADDHSVGTPVEGARTHSVIDLRPGKFSSTHGMDNNIAIAFGTMIENAIGTQFNDKMIGNNANNSLLSGAGDDVLNGGKGNDKLKGQGGADTFVFSKKFDSDKIIKFENNVDVLRLNDNLWSGRKSVKKVLKLFAEQHKNAVVFDFGGGDKLKITGIKKADLKNDIDIF